MMEQRRRIASWVLLSVFLPMIVLTSLHTHSVQLDADNTCVQCEHHLPHAGHLSAQSAVWHDCVVCQMVSLPFLLPATVVFFALSLSAPVSFAVRPFLMPAAVVDSRSARAPPYAF